MTITEIAIYCGALTYRHCAPVKNLGVVCHSQRSLIFVHLTIIVFLEQVLCPLFRVFVHISEIKNILIFIMAKPISVMFYGGCPYRYPGSLLSEVFTMLHFTVMLPGRYWQFGT